MVSVETILYREKPFPIKDILSELTHIMSGEPLCGIAWNIMCL